jgi:hypothetical protein
VKLEDRIAQAERAMEPEKDTREEERARQYWELWERKAAALTAILETMPEEYARPAFEVLAAKMAGEQPDPEPSPGLAALVNAIEERAQEEVHPQGNYKPSGPLAMPAEVCRAYMEHPEARPNNDCAGCGYSMPVLPGGIKPLPTCPFCGGAVGWYAWTVAHRSQKGADTCA